MLLLLTVIVEIILKALLANYQYPYCFYISQITLCCINQFNLLYRKRTNGCFLLDLAGRED